MGRNRKTYSESFKKEVAVEALKEKTPVAELATAYGISPSMVTTWKKAFLNGEFSNVDSIAIFGILSIPIFRIEKDMVFAPFVKRYFLNVIEFSGLVITG